MKLNIPYWQWWHLCIGFGYTLISAIVWAKTSQKISCQLLCTQFALWFYNNKLHHTDMASCINASTIYWTALLCHLVSEIIIVFWTMCLFVCILSPLHLLFAMSCRHSEKKRNSSWWINLWPQLCESLVTASQNFRNVRNASDHLTSRLSALTPHCTLHGKWSVMKLEFGPTPEWVVRL